MIRSFRLAAAICALTTVLAAGQAHAALMTFGFSGSVSQILHDDSANTFSANFAVGDPVTGSWTIDTAATQHSLLTTASYYDATFNATVSGKNFSGPSQYRIFDNAPGVDDGFSVINETGTYTAPVLGALQPKTFFIQFLGMPTSTLADQSIVTDPVSLIPSANLSLAPHGLRLDSPDGSYGALYFTIDKVSVPEPSSLTLGLFAASLVARAARRRLVA